MLTSLCIASFYFFVKKYFGFEVAMFATPLLASMPGLIWFSVRIRPDILLLLLVIIALYFAGKKATNFNVVSSAIFVALSHFTHPLAILLGVAVFISLLMRKKLKASILFLSTWIVIMIPWLVRNYLIFEDPIRGFGMPIPRELLTTFGLVSPDSKVLDVYPDEFYGVSMIDTLQGMLYDFTHVYGMEYFLIFVSLSLVAFISFNALRFGLSNIFRNIIPLSIGLALYSIGIYYVISGSIFDNNFIVQSLFVFAIPLSIFLYIKIFSSHKNIFTAHKNIYMVIGLYAIINLLMYFIYPQLSGRIVPEIRIIIIALYTLIPLAIIGLRKILSVIFSYIKVTYRKRIIFISMSIILFSFAFYQTSIGINVIDARFERLAGETQHFNMNDWIRANIPPNSKTASDMPHALTLQTGLPSVNFHHWYKDNTSYENWIIKKFDIDYLVFYYPKHGSTGLSILDLGDINLEKIYQDPEGTFIYRVYQD
ncbi:MAG TPA: glycosyltransferase family 39 protein, partial [Candidatus Nitrosocosmicus sp.]|nr:glycosyltransferase family 39 protein [Candidatus Nitrosocosmicus sp.]